MTIPHPASRPAQPGPNQWIKDHLDSVIDAELLDDRPDRNAPAAEPRGPVRAARP
ncbi:MULTISPECIES: hypothetical protein [unclassified Streptomyces]|uniref:hypothetical protein n=1 Tax=unclassified Streptomyces TaxID=2593676 RepID=UPI0034099934